MLSLAACVLSSESGSALSPSSGRAVTGTCYHRLIRHTRDGAGFTGPHTCTLHSPGTHGHISDPWGERWHQAVVNRQHPEYHPRWWCGGKRCFIDHGHCGSMNKGVRELRYVTKPQTTTRTPRPGPLPCRHTRTHNLPHTGTQLIPDTSTNHRAEATSNPSRSGGISHVLIFFLRFWIMDIEEWGMG